MYQDVQENAQRPAVHLRDRGGRDAQQRHSMCCRWRAAVCVSNTMADKKVSSEGFQLPSLVTKDKVRGVAEGSGPHRQRCCQSLPPGKDSHSIGAVARPLPSSWVKGGVAGGDENQGTRTRHTTRRPPFYALCYFPSRLGKPLPCRRLSFMCCKKEVTCKLPHLPCVTWIQGCRQEEGAYLWTHIGLPVDDLR